MHSVWVGDEEHKARTVILAMGAEHKKLAIPGEDELGGRGVSYCATCDAAFFKQKPTMIVGGGDSAMEEAIFLSKFASKVVVVHRRDEFRASKIMLERARGDREHRVDDAVRARGVRRRRQRLARSRAPAPRRQRRDDRRRRSRASSSRSATSRSRSSSTVWSTIDDEGYVITEGRSTRTKRPGVFAAGDLVDHTYRQAVTAAGSGTQAALDAEWYLRDTPEIDDARRTCPRATWPRRSGRRPRAEPRRRTGA